MNAWLDRKMDDLMEVCNEKGMRCVCSVRCAFAQMMLGVKQAERGRWTTLLASLLSVSGGGGVFCGT